MEYINNRSLNRADLLQTPFEKRINALERLVEDERISPDKFKGKRYFDGKFLKEADKVLRDKKSRRNDYLEEDKFAPLAECEYTYAMNHGEIFGNCRASLTSEYDDELNGIDIICTLKDADGKSLPNGIFGIDIVTATLQNAVQKKFKRGDEARGVVPSGCAFVKFYEDNNYNYVASLNGVPRFVLGATPAFVGDGKYMQNFQIEENGNITHNPDPDLQFNILSNLYIQSLMIKERLQYEKSGKEETCARAIETCKRVQSLSYERLKTLLGVSNDKEFSNRFSKEVDKFAKKKVNSGIDTCYRNIFLEAVVRRQELRQKIRNSKSKSA